jgi:subtilase family serine protease
MEQEPLSNISPEPGKEPDSKKFMIAIITVLSIALIGMIYLFLFNLGKNSQTENESEESNATSGKISSSSALNENSNSSAIETTLENNATKPESTTPEEVKKADLYVKSHTFSKDPKVGSEFTVTIVIGNKGQAVSSESYWEWWANASKQACKKKVGAIAVGGSSTVECDYTYTDWDEYTTKVIVDSQDDVSESNENNNIATKDATPKHKKADLTITEYEFNHDPVMGEEFKVEITIKNKGETDAKDFEWEWWSNASSSSCDGEVNELEAGESKEVSCKYTYGGWSTYTTKAVVDPDDDVDEEDESNNTLTKTVIPEH